MVEKRKKCGERDRDVQKKRMTIEGRKFDVEASHPCAFEKGVYRVYFHKHGTLYVDRNIYHTMVEARNSKEAIEKGLNELKKKEKRWIVTDNAYP